MNVGQQLLNVPFPQMVYELASSVARAQMELDRETVEILKEMGDKSIMSVELPFVYYDKNNKIVQDKTVTSMIGAGFQPTFYQFAETIIEVKMAITATSQETSEGKKTESFVNFNRMRRTFITATPVDASYSNKYNYSQEGSSFIRTRLVPVPPNTIIQRRVEMCSEAMQKDIEANLNAKNLSL